MFIYLAHPIDQVERTPGLVLTAKSMLKLLNVSGFRPSGSYHLASPKATDKAKVNEINGFALAACDALLAVLPAGTPTLGTPTEIEQALVMGKPVVILTDSTAIYNSIQIAQWIDRGATPLLLPGVPPIGFPIKLHQALKGRPRRMVDVTTFGQEPGSEMIPGELLRRFPGDDLDLLVQLDPAAKAPTRAHSDDAGLDLAIIEETRIYAGEYKMIRTGVRAAVPEGWWGMITGRSSTWLKYRCDVRMAVIDAGYRGELMIGIENRGNDAMTFEAGTRLAQYVLIPTFPGAVTPVDRLPEAHRGESGYGSSGE